MRVTSKVRKKRGELLRDGSLREFLFGDVREDGFIFFTYSWNAKLKKYYPSWASPEAFRKAAERNRQSYKNWYVNNPEKVKTRRIVWRQNNRETYRKHCRDWQKNNPGKVSQRIMERIAREKNATLMISRDQKRIMDCVYEARSRISKCTGIPHQVDHIIPLSRGGFHIHTNLQVLPAKLNRQKSNKLPHELAA